MVVVFAVGAADQRGADACHRHDFFVALLHVGDDGVGGERIEMVVGVRMVHDLMPCFGDGFAGVGVVVCPVADHEKGSLDLILRQYIQYLLRIVCAPG